jgi:hypothetical protein
MRLKMNISKKLAAVVVLISVAVMLVVGCARTKQARKFEGSGFLDDYTVLQAGGKGEELMIYRNPDAYWPGYKKILLDPIQIWRDKEKAEKAPLEDLQRLANNFNIFLRDELTKDYKMVTLPGPATLRIQIALTDVQKSTAALDTVTTVLPPAYIITSGVGFASGKPPFTGQAAFEGRIVDAHSGTLLAAAVDRRVGGKAIKNWTDSWDDANQVLKIWSKMLRVRLCQFRGDKNCVE